MGISVFPKLYCLVGGTTTRLSLAMHNAAFRERSVEAFYLNLTTAETAEASRILRELKFSGASLTIPHKEAALEFVDDISAAAKEIGAINTVIAKDGKFFGENTDWIGIAESLKEASVDVAKEQALVLGAGGAACAAIYALQKLNAKQITITNRAASRAGELATRCALNFLDWAESTKKMGDFSLIVNMTAIGLDAEKTNSASYPFLLAQLRKDQTVFEAVTKDTPLIVAARKNGARTISGLRMILFQALEQFKLFTGADSAPREVMERALLTEWRRMNEK